jgi:hypothetical protein
MGECSVKTLCSLPIVVAISLLVAVSPAASQTYTFEIYAGNYDPDPDILDDDATFGLRLGHWFNKRVTLQGSLGFFKVDEEFSEGETGAEIDADIILVDVSLGYLFRSDKKRFRPVVFGGIGGSFASIDATVTTPNLIALVDDLDRDSLTLHAGFGPIFQVSERFYIRPSARFRWYENREDDEIDQELSLNFGWAFRRP